MCILSPREIMVVQEVFKTDLVTEKIQNHRRFCKLCYIYITRHDIDNHFRLSFIPNLVFHDPSSDVPRRSIGHLSNVTSTVSTAESDIGFFYCSRFKLVEFKWIYDKERDKMGCWVYKMLMLLKNIYI